MIKRMKFEKHLWSKGGNSNLGAINVDCK